MTDRLVTLGRGDPSTRRLHDETVSCGGLIIIPNIETVRMCRERVGLEQPLLIKRNYHATVLRVCRYNAYEFRNDRTRRDDSKRAQRPSSPKISFALAGSRKLRGCTVSGGLSGKSRNPKLRTETIYSGTTSRFRFSSFWMCLVPAFIRFRLTDDKFAIATAVRCTYAFGNRVRARGNNTRNCSETRRFRGSSLVRQFHSTLVYVGFSVSTFEIFVFKKKSWKNNSV